MFINKTCKVKGHYIHRDKIRKIYMYYSIGTEIDLNHNN